MLRGPPYRSITIMTEPEGSFVLCKIKKGNRDYGAVFKAVWRL